MPAKNIAELIALAKKKPGKLNYTSAGMGSYPHLDMEKFMKASGTEMTHVPYKGGAGQAIPAMVAGEVQVAFFNMASLLPHIRSGRLKALAAFPRSACPSSRRADPRRAGLSRDRHQRLAGHVRAGGHAQAGRGQVVRRGRRGAPRPDRRKARQADDGRRIVEIAAGVHRTGAPRDAGLGEFLREAKIRVE